MGLIAFLIVGALAGWIAGLIMKGRGFGLLGNVVVGVVGAILGGWLLRTLGVFPPYGFGGSLATALLGAVVLLALAGVLKRA